MKTILWTILLSTTALAADMKAPVAQTATAPSWARFYLGLHAGYGFGDIKTIEELSFDPKGVAFGGQAGYNWQYSQLVAGVEVDATWLGNRDRPGICEGECAGKFDLIGSARARLGTTIFSPRILAYGTGGLAWAHTTLSLGDLGLGRNHFGWTAGGGLEVLMGNHWTARVEYIHYDFGSNQVMGILPTSEKYNVVRGGLNLKF